MLDARRMAGGILLLGLLVAAKTPGDSASSQTAEWNGIKIRCSTRHGAIRVKSGPKKCRVEIAFDGDAAHGLTITAKDLRLDSSTLGVKKSKRLPVDGVQEITFTGEPDQVTLDFKEVRTSSHSSRTSRISKDGTSTSSSSSSSKSSSTSSDVRAVKIIKWNGKLIELALDGGRSIQSTVESDDQRCIIRFDIDEGKNKRVIRLKPHLIDIDGKPRHTGDYARLRISATKRALTLEADKKVVGRWKGDMDEQVLRD